MSTERTTTILAALLLLAVAVPASGQSASLTDGRWLPYLGCWVDVEAPEAAMTCMVPDGDGVAQLTVEEAVTSRKALRGDGQERPVDVAGCTGSESARFSDDGYRLYTRANLSCGAGVERETRGLMAMVEVDQWIEVRALGTGEGSVAWVKRYRPAPATRVEAAGLADALAGVPPQALEVARAAASAPLAIADIIEANARTDAEAVRAWIAEQGDPLPLSADRLVQLADAGVPAEVIDVAVAVSFPDRFAVGREAREPRTDDRDRWGYGRTGAWGLWSPYWPYYNDPFYFRYNRFGYYGYGLWGSGYYGYRPSVVVVAPVEDTPRGRMIRGQGYTRGGSGGSIGTASPRPSIRPGTPSSSGARVGTGYRGSSSSGSKGKAKPKGSGSGG